MRGRANAAAFAALVLAWGAPRGGSQALEPRTPQQLIAAMIANENEAASHNDHYEYLSNERSVRTGGHLWTERVVETTPGRVRLLLAIDGQPLSPDRMAKERARVADIEAHPDTFIRHEQNTRAEEKRARDLLHVLPKDFIFENVRLENGVWSLSFRPDPGYKPSGIEERVMHNMAGTITIDQHDLRLIHMDFHLTQDVTFGFGLLADVHTGTNFVSDRQKIDGRWHTLHVATEVRAKAVMFKTVDLNLDLTRSEFQPLDHELTVPEAAALLLRSP
jgi:hypothetical protein